MLMHLEENASPGLAEPLRGKALQIIRSQAQPTRVCACQPYFYVAGKWDKHRRPCLLQHAVLHLFWRGLWQTQAKQHLAAILCAI